MKIHGTAKAGALSTKDFGVALSAPTPAVETCQGESYSGDQKGLGQDTAHGSIDDIGFKPSGGNTLIDTLANNFSLKMKLTGSPTNPVVGARIYDDSDVLQQTSTNTIDDLDGTFTQRTFNFASTFTVTEDYSYVIYQVSGSTFNDSNGVYINMKNTAVDNNVDTYKTDSGWYSHNLSVTVCFIKT